MSFELFQKVAEVVAENRKIGVEKITLDTTFDELGMDSLSGLSLIYDLEDAFEIEIPNEEAMSIKTVRQIVESLKKLDVSV